MTEHLAPALAVALQHERRRHNPLPPLRDLIDCAERVGRLEAALIDAAIQIEYLHDKFGETGSGNQVLARIRHALDGDARMMGGKDAV